MLRRRTWEVKDLSGGMGKGARSDDWYFGWVVGCGVSVCDVTVVPSSLLACNKSSGTPLVSEALRCTRHAASRLVKAWSRVESDMLESETSDVVGLAVEGKACICSVEVEIKDDVDVLVLSSGVFGRSVTFVAF